MENTVGHTFSFDELSIALNGSIRSFPNPTSFEQQAYFEGTYPVEVNSDPQALLKRFKDIEDRLAQHVGEPVVCIRDGDIVLLYMGFVKSPRVIFQYDQNSFLPRGSASIEVSQHQIAAIVFDDKGGADIEIIPVANGRVDTYFHFEEREFKKINDDPETFDCEASNWDLLIGNDEISKFFGQARLLLPIRQGLVTPDEFAVIDASATELPPSRGLDR